MYIFSPFFVNLFSGNRFGFPLSLLTHLRSFIAFLSPPHPHQILYLSELLRFSCLSFLLCTNSPPGEPHEKPLPVSQYRAPWNGHIENTERGTRPLRVSSCTCLSIKLSKVSILKTVMQKADGLRLFQFNVCLWFLLGWRAADGADLTGGRMPELGGGGKRKVGEAPCGRK